MPAETDLTRMLATLQVDVRPGEYVFVSVKTVDDALATMAQASIRENEGVTYVLRREDADNRQLRYDYRAAWLTLRVHSALAAVGLTAAVATVLAQHEISCNVLAAYYHDHLLVPADRVDDAVAALTTLRQHASFE